MCSLDCSFFFFRFFDIILSKFLDIILFRFLEALSWISCPFLPWHTLSTRFGQMSHFRPRIRSELQKKPVHNCVFNNTINLQIHVNLQRRSLVSKIMKSVCPPKYKSSFGLFAIPMQTIVNEIDENNVLWTESARLAFCFARP